MNREFKCVRCSKVKNEPRFFICLDCKKECEEWDKEDDEMDLRIIEKWKQTGRLLSRLELKNLKES